MEPFSALTFIYVHLFCQIINGEILTYDTVNSAPNIIECMDPYTDCVVNCVSDAVCRHKQIHCHRNSTTSKCKINLIGTNSGRNIYIFTHKSPIIYLNVLGLYSCYQSEVFAYGTLGAKLYVYVTADQGMRYSRLFSPVGEGSLLFMQCTGQGCRGM